MSKIVIEENNRERFKIRRMTVEMVGNECVHSQVGKLLLYTSCNLTLLTESQELVHIYKNTHTNTQMRTHTGMKTSTIYISIETDRPTDRQDDKLRLHALSCS